MQGTAFKEFCRLQEIKIAKDLNAYSELEYSVAVLAWDAAVDAAKQMVDDVGMYNSNFMDVLKTGDE